MINNIKNNTISETDVIIKINELNKIKKVETKGRRLNDSQKTLLSLFDDLKTIFIAIIIVIITRTIVIIKMKVKMKMKM